jgi:hypothetical protein
MMPLHAAWQTGKPPHQQVVEVEDDGRIIRVRAQWGRDGYLPHWESEDRDTLWRPSAFTRWRFPEGSIAKDGRASGAPTPDAGGSAGKPDPS